MSRKGITENQFNRVIKLIAAKKPMAEIVTKEKLTASTLRSIRQAGTWAEYERRKRARVQRLSAERAMHPEPLPQSATLIGERHSDVPPVRFGKQETRGTKKAIAKPQVKKAVTELPMLYHTLNDAYKASIVRSDEDRKKTEELWAALEEAREDLKAAAFEFRQAEKLLRPMVEEHNSAMAQQVVDVIGQSKSKRWWPFRGRK